MKLFSFALTGAVRLKLKRKNKFLGKHSIVFDLRFTERGRVTGDDDQLALPGPKSLQSLLVSQAVLSRLHNQSKSGIDRFIRLLTLIMGNILGSNSTYVYAHFNISQKDLLEENKLLNKTNINP